MSVEGSLREGAPGAASGAAPGAATGSRASGTRARAALALGSVLRVAVVVAGAIGILVAGIAPIWGSRLIAPQYPRGLALWVHSDRSTGDTFEINSLNHYIGMRPIDVVTVPELALWPLVLVTAGVLLVVATYAPGRLGRLALVGLVLIPVGVVADIQRWLITYGTELDPAAALRLDPFVPLAIGPSTVWNFTIWTYPGPALVILLAVALVAGLARRAPMPSVAVRAGSAAAVLAALALGIWLLVPRVAPAATGAAPPPPSAFDLARLIEEAPAGPTLVVPAGTYRGPVVIDRSLTIEAGGDVLIDGGGRGSVVTIAASDVTLRGFRVANSGGQVEEAAGILVQGDRVTLEGNVVERSFTGIAAYGVDDLRLVDNDVRGSGQVVVDAADHVGARSGGGGQPAGSALRSPAPDDPPAAHTSHAVADPVSGPRGQGDGISLWTVRGALLRDNRITGVRDGVYLNYAEEVLLDSNTVAGSRYAVHAMFGSDVVAFGNELRRNLSGLVLMYTENVEVGRNTIADHRSAGTGLGIVIKDVRGVRIRENIVLGNRTGLQAEGTVHDPELPAVVAANRFSANDVGVALMATTDLMFGGNVFDANLTQVRALEPGVGRRNLWAYRGAGNLWSDYRGFDLAGDGLGDVPYRAGGAEQVVLAAAPALQAYRTAPAYAVLEAAQGVWDAGREPVVLDARPLTVDPLPPAHASVPADAPVAWAGAGAALVALALVARGWALRVSFTPTRARDVADGQPA